MRAEFESPASSDKSGKARLPSEVPVQAGIQRRWILEAPGPASLVESISFRFNEMLSLKNLKVKSSQENGRQNTDFCLHIPQGHTHSPNTCVQTHTLKKEGNLIFVIIELYLIENSTLEKIFEIFNLENYLSKQKCACS